MQDFRNGLHSLKKKTTMLTHFHVILCVFLPLNRIKLRFRALYFSPSQMGPNLFTLRNKKQQHKKVLKIIENN